MFSAENALLDKTLTYHKHDLFLEFITGGSFNGENFAKSREGFLLKRTLSASEGVAQASLSYSLCSRSLVPGEGETGAALHQGVEGSHSSSCSKEDVISFTKENFYHLGYYQ